MKGSRNRLGKESVRMTVGFSLENEPAAQDSGKTQGKLDLKAANLRDGLPPKSGGQT